MKKIALLGVGNSLRGDDGVGVFVAKSFENDLKVFLGGDAPENTFNEIRSFAPDILIVIDAISVFGGSLKEPEFLDLSDEISYFYSTHNIPANVYIRYLRDFIPQVLFLGIEISIENILDFAQNLSPEARQNAKIAIEKIKKFINDCSL